VEKPQKGALKREVKDQRNWKTNTKRSQRKEGRKHVRDFLVGATAF